MQNIKNYDKAIETMLKEHVLVHELIDSAELFTAYQTSVNKGLDLIDFDGPIWDAKLQGIHDAMVDNGVTKFTVSSTYSHVTDTIAMFLDLGWHIEGMTKVDSGYTKYDFDLGEEVPDMRNAFVLAR